MPVSMITSQQSQNTKSNTNFVQRTEVAAAKSNNQTKPKIIKKNVGFQLAPITTKTKVVDVSLPPTLPGRK